MNFVVFLVRQPSFVIQSCSQVCISGANLIEAEKYTNY